MPGKNEAMMFSESDIIEIEQIMSKFADILKKMGLIAEVGVSTTSDYEVVRTFYTILGEKKCNHYKKSIVCTWEETLNKIKADLFNELNRISSVGGKWIPCNKEMPPSDKNCRVWISFITPWGGYVKKASWVYNHFEWENGKQVKDEPDAWQLYNTPSYYAPEPY